MKLYHVDIRICGTAYVVADNPARAKALVQQHLTDSYADLKPDGDLVREDLFSALIAEGEGLSLSPGITLYGPWPDSDLEEVKIS